MSSYLFFNLASGLFFTMKYSIRLLICFTLKLCSTFAKSEDSVCHIGPSTLNEMSKQIRIIPRKKLFVSEPNPAWFGNGPNDENNPSWTNGNWLKSRFHFSFAEYNNPYNTHFGSLRVMNDDLVQPRRGFGTHPHRNMEIITYIVQGQLTHQDSMGTKESLGRGSIQFMTAGTGVQHSEFNHGDTPLRFIQTWIMPSRNQLKPNYGSFDPKADGVSYTLNVLNHLVSNVEDKSSSTPVEINQDVDAYAAEIERGKSVSIDLAQDRQAYLLCIEGGVTVNGKSMEKHDGCEILTGGPIVVEASQVEDTENGKLAHILVFVMKQAPKSGRADI